MSWFKVDDTLPMSPKVLSCPLGAIGLWTICGAWSCQQLTDGFIPRAFVEAIRSNEASASFASDLLRVGLWEEVEGGYQFHDWAEYQPSAREVKEERIRVSEARRNAGRAGGIASGKTRRSKTKQPRSKREANGSKREANGSPDPTHSITSKEVILERAFNTFWEAYPRKDDKKAAHTKWLTAVKVADPDIIIDGAKRYAESVKGGDPTYVKYAKTWLHNECWNETYQPPEPQRIEYVDDEFAYLDLQR